MDEWESDRDSEEERDGGDYLEKQDQEGEELELFYETGQRDRLVLGQIYITRNSTAKLLESVIFIEMRFLCAHLPKRK